jgi:hypothetical protein
MMLRSDHLTCRINRLGDAAFNSDSEKGLPICHLNAFFGRPFAKIQHQRQAELDFDEENMLCSLNQSLLIVCDHIEQMVDLETATRFIMISAIHKWRSSDANRECGHC